MPDWDELPQSFPADSWGRITTIDGTPERMDGMQRRVGDPNSEYYQITPIDVIYFATSINYEDRAERELVGWAEIQRFVAHRTLVTGTPTINSLKREVETFSQPVNPAWAWISPVEETRSEQDSILIGNRRWKLASPVVIDMGVQDINTGVPGPPLQAASIKAGYKLMNNDEAASEAAQQRRRNNIRQLRAISQGDVGEWRGLAENARRAAFEIARGQCGNPIPGFDDFASYRVDEQRLVRLYNLPTETHENVLNEFRNNPRMSRSPRALSRLMMFNQGGEFYVYHSVHPTRSYGTVVIRSPSGDSTQAPVRDYRGGAPARRSGGGGGGGSGGGGGGGGGTVPMPGEYNLVQWEVHDGRNEDTIAWARETVLDLNDTVTGRRF